MLSSVSIPKIPSALRSCRVPLISVVKGTDLRDRHNPSEVRSLNGSVDIAVLSNDRESMNFLPATERRRAG
jgi:hypothetical protein